MCGYQCDKALTKNDTREVIWYHFTAVKWYHITSRFELSNQINCNNLVGPIRCRYILADAWRLASNLAGRFALQFYRNGHFKICECLQWRYFWVSQRERKQEHGKKNFPRCGMWYVINKLLHVKIQIVFYSLVFNTISRTSESSSEWAIWY